MPTKKPVAKKKPKKRAPKRGVVMHCGDRASAIAYLTEHGGAGKAIVGGSAVAGDRGSAVAGQGGSISIRYWDVVDLTSGEARFVKKPVVAPAAPEEAVAF